VARVFTLGEARGLVPEVLSRAAELVAVRADLVELQIALARGVPSPLGALPEAKGLEARLSELLSWFPEQGLDVKGVAPLLVDFPATLNGETVLLCWLEGEHELGWYHKPEHGFAGRRVIPVPGPPHKPPHKPPHGPPHGPPAGPPGGLPGPPKTRL
jgi:hypothetical protein